MSLLKPTPPFYLAGQRGKAFGPGKVHFGQAGVQAASLELKSMEIDQLTLETRGVEFSWMQEVSLYDSTGTRLFWGNVTTCDPTWHAHGPTWYHVEISGPWWWLERGQLSALAPDGTSTASDRPEFVFPVQSVDVSIRALMTRMAALGVPLGCGELSPAYLVPQMVFQGMDASSTLRTLLNWIPDAATRVRYDGLGVPGMDVVRRPFSERVEYQVGQDGCLLLDEPLRFRQRRELKPLSVSVQSARVDASGTVIFEEHSAGSPAEAGILGRQLVAISGPGQRGWQPVEVRKYALKTTSSVASAMTAKSAQLSSLNQQIGVQPYIPMTVTANIWVPTSGGGVYYSIPAALTTKWEGDPPEPHPGHYVLSEALPDWWSALGVQTAKVTIRQRFIAVLPGNDTKNGPVSALSFSAITDGANRIYFADIEETFEVVSLAAPSGQLVLHPEDAAMIQPVPGLAENLLAAQNFIQIDGAFGLRPWSPAPTPGMTVSIRGARPEWSDMRAMVAGLSIDLISGSTQVSLGRSVRDNAEALGERFQRPTSPSVMRLHGG